MTPNPSHARRMSAKDYLAEKGRDFLERAYAIHAGGVYSNAADRIVSDELGPIAKMDGVETRLTPDTLCKARSRSGLVHRSSPRPAKATAPAEASPAQSELPGVHDDGAERAGWAAVKQQQRTNDLLIEIRTMLAGAIGRGVISQGNAAATEAEPEARPRPVAVAGGGA